MKEIIYPCQPFAKSVEFYHHKSRHTKLDYFIAFFPSIFFLTMMKSEVVYYFYGFIVL